jgi:5-methylcytosine-specific restriction endonuclease McrA
MNRPCLICGRISDGSRCPDHRIPPRRSEYQRNAALVRAAALTCHVCGQGFSAADPPVADHIRPRIFGGDDSLDNLAPAHASCNGRRGAALAGIYQGGGATT